MLTIEPMLVLSTAHVRQETLQRIEQDAIAYENEYGAFIYAGANANLDRLPDDLKAVVELAQENHCVWVKLDRDGDTTEKLPIYDW